MQTPEPHSKASSCAYCGDAPASHTLFYLENIISSFLDPKIKKVTFHAPNFIKSFVDWLPPFTFRVFAFLRLAKFSDDIDKANTFRSRVMWEEAKRQGIKMEQLILFKKPIDYYRAQVSGKKIYFNSLPIPVEFLDTVEDWDDKFVLKEKFGEAGIPTPHFEKLPFFHSKKLAKIFDKFTKPVIVKPKIGSRGRHTTTSINTLSELEEAIKIAKEISPHLIVEEHLHGYVCRATLVRGKLMGFYRGEAPYVIGDGIKTIKELIEERNNKRPERVEEIKVGQEISDYISRAGFTLENIIPQGMRLLLSHRVGRLFGGHTREMLDELHPSFMPILVKAMETTGLAVAGFDCIVPDPTQSAESQRWGIIECNTLPFIDLHYYALEGSPKNIAGEVWNLWK